MSAQIAGSNLRQLEKSTGPPSAAATYKHERSGRRLLGEISRGSFNDAAGSSGRGVRFLLGILGLDRTRKQIALYANGPTVGQELQLCRSFHTFRHHLQSQPMTQGHDRTHDRRGSWVGVHSLDQHPVE